MVVYFIQCGEGGPIKIGHSKNVVKRLISIQLNNPTKLTLICAIDGGKTEEKALHSKFKKDNILGEWFSPCPELIEFMSQQEYLGYMTTRGKKLEKNSCWKGVDASDNTKRQRVVRLIELSDCEICGKPGTDRHHQNGDLNDMVNISILCRKCCMEKDGRMAKFKANAIKAKEHLKKPPRECIICKEVKKHHSNGRCKACDGYFRKQGIERPISVVQAHNHKKETADLRKRLAAAKGNDDNVPENCSSDHDDAEKPQ